MTYNPKNFYNYFKACYQIDYKEFEIDNILAVKHHYKWFVEKTEELLSDRFPLIPYFNKKVLDLEKEIELYRLEKKLFYGCFFILGKKESTFSKDKRVCAPLFLFPASIETHDEEKFLKIDKENLIVNRAILSKLDLKNPALDIDQFIEEVTQIIFEENDELISLKSTLDKFFSNLNTEELPLYPSVWQVKKVRKHLSETKYKDSEYKIVPAAGTVFVEKSSSSIKVIRDLEEIAERGKFNSGLEKLLNRENDFNPTQVSGLYKSRLNTDQFKALENTYKYDNSVIVGPPGTGKTYTTTSIVTDAVLNNKSVLVVSKTKQAVEVLRKMLQDDFKLKDYLIHTTGFHYKLSLKSKIRKLLSGISSRNRIQYDDAHIKSMYTKLEGLETEFETIVDKELRLSDLEFTNDPKFLDIWRKFYLDITTLDKQKIWKVFTEIEKTLASLEREISRYTKRKIQENIRLNFRMFRQDLSLFFDALDTSSFSEYKRNLEFIDQANILKVFPIWLTSLSELNSVVFLKKDLFDLVIIDESTQCDMASTLPALYRAKKAIIVGDPNQLRHYSFVSQAQQARLREEFDLPEEKLFDYRNKSILDLFISNVPDQNQITFLREHFRSTPSLIEFSNRAFYDGQLEVIKSTPKHTANNQLKIIDAKGTKNQKGHNEIEAKAVIQKLDTLLEELKDSPTKSTIGIISPFSKQVVYINKLIKEKYSLEVLKKHQLFCGTPYSFQGSERDIILLSFCVCDKSHPSSFIHVNKPEVLNVAITRAKSFQYIFKSVSQQSLKSESLLAQYLSFAENFTHTDTQEEEKDLFQQEVYEGLKKIGYQNIHCSYPLAGSILDILVCHNQKNYFIDLIGYPGMFKEAFTLERYKTLARTGVKCFPLHYSFWKKNKHTALKRIVKLMS